jgi:hypothetical protein
MAFLIQISASTLTFRRSCREGARALLALQAAQSAYLVALHRMDARRAPLVATDMQTAGVKLD